MFAVVPNAEWHQKILAPSVQVLSDTLDAEEGE